MVLSKHSDILCCRVLWKVIRENIIQVSMEPFFFEGGFCANWLSYPSRGDEPGFVFRLHEGNTHSVSTGRNHANKQVAILVRLELQNYFLVDLYF